ncbi:MAG: hypothetical protein ABMA15_00545 [Vicinamibacterales bacterium]
MSGWLDPVHRALDARDVPVALFVRDDDAGWADERLAGLLDTCAWHGVPLALAVIPSELTGERAQWLTERRRAYPARLGFHQHGWAHMNHEPTGRKCEFGASRSLDDLRMDLTQGHARMVEAFGASVDPVFTPPWNRCVEAVGPLLVEMGVEVLSRDVTAGVLGVAGLRECPVHVDWSGKKRGVRLTRNQLGASCADVLTNRPVAGVLFHHAVMDDLDLEDVSALLDTLRRHSMVQFVSLVEAASLATSPPVPDATTAAEASA